MQNYITVWISSQVRRVSSVVLVMLAFSAFGGEVAQDEARDAVKGWAALKEAFAPGAVAYQWYCDGEPIDGATGQTLDVSWSKSKEPAVYTARAADCVREYPAIARLDATFCAVSRCRWRLTAADTRFSMSATRTTSPNCIHLEDRIYGFTTAGAGSARQVRVRRTCARS